MEDRGLAYDVEVLPSNGYIVDKPPTTMSVLRFSNWLCFSLYQGVEHSDWLIDWPQSSTVQAYQWNLINTPGLANPDLDRIETGLKQD